MPSRIDHFIEEADKLFNLIFPDLEIVWFGHVGDGNLHLNILKPANLSKEEFFIFCHEMSEQLYSLIEKYQGTVSAEHGIGLLKKGFLSHTRRKTEIDYMQSIKKLFDPNNIMNPGKIF